MTFKGGAAAGATGAWTGGSTGATPLTEGGSVGSEILSNFRTLAKNSSARKHTKYHQGNAN